MIYFDDEDLAAVADEDLEELYEAITQGAGTLAEATGFDDGALNAIEHIAKGYYQAARYNQAAPVFAFILKMNPRRPSTWRGLGACAQALKQYELAGHCYVWAVEQDPHDPISKIFLGEVLCLEGRAQEGLKILNEVVEGGGADAKVAPYLSRARAIIAAEGGMPPAVVLKRQGLELAKTATEALGGAVPAFVEDPDREIEWEDMKQDPKLMENIRELTQAVKEGRLTLAEVGGFSQKELDGAYACACKYAELGQVAQAVQIAGYLIFLNPHDARCYQLVGICMQRLGQYEGADHFYRMAATLDADNAMTAVYRGEAKIMAGQVDEGVGIVKAGLDLAEKEPTQNRELIHRAHALIQQFSA